MISLLLAAPVDMCARIESFQAVNRCHSLKHHNMQYFFPKVQQDAVVDMENVDSMTIREARVNTTNLFLSVQSIQGRLIFHTNQDISVFVAPHTFQTDPSRTPGQDLLPHTPQLGKHSLLFPLFTLHVPRCEILCSGAPTRP